MDDSLYKVGELVKVYEFYNDGIVRNAFPGLVVDYKSIDCPAPNTYYFIYDAGLIKKVIESSIENI